MSPSMIGAPSTNAARPQHGWHTPRTRWARYARCSSRKRAAKILRSGQLAKWDRLWQRVGAGEAGWGLRGEGWGVRGEGWGVRGGDGGRGGMRREVEFAWGWRCWRRGVGVREAGGVGWE